MARMVGMIGPLLFLLSPWEATALAQGAVGTVSSSVSAKLGPCFEPRRPQVVRKSGEKGESWGPKPPRYVCVEGTLSKEDSALLEAARAGSASRMRRALDDGASLLAWRRLYWAEHVPGTVDGFLRRLRIETPLILAASVGSLAGVRLVLTPDTAKRDGGEAMAVAAVRAHFEVVRALSDAGVSPNAPIEDGSPMAAVIRERRIAALKLLLELGGDPRPPQLLLLAVQSGSPNNVRALIAAGAEPNEETFSEAKDPAMLKLLLEKGTAPSELTLAKVTDVAIAKVLLGAGANPRGAGGVVALWNAAFEGNAQLVRLLLEKGADPNAPLPKGPYANLFEGERSLRPPCPLLAAIGGFHMRAEIVKDLLKRGTDPNCGVSKSGLTPLMVWVQRAATKWPEGASDVVKALIQAGADPMIAGARGTTPIDDAKAAALAEGTGGNARRALKALCAELRGELKAACSKR